MSHALVLNATYEPLGVVAPRRAILLVLSGKAIPVESTDEVVHSVEVTLGIPSVLRLCRHVRVPHRAGVPLTRRAVFARDGGSCAYCGGQATSIDHVVPRSKGGAHVWDNVVSACERCNRLKADRTIAELGWRLRVAPRQPVGTAWRILSTGRAEEAWRPYLAAYGAEVGIA